ncbi:hypothetical protein STRMA_1238 [Streptococcus macacae NCTC 11558]|uniref:Uncharacterized protein n=1 Tax=Streptococcus macacae NCTC 11558 TaxID=764298 RepID=G5JWU1_9STRE|nr:hypothetical protein STRMA_1238 [Streptococcus macacae NCTC 11558]
MIFTIHIGISEKSDFLLPFLTACFLLFIAFKPSWFKA